jgi:hypothetical protein
MQRELSCTLEGARLARESKVADAPGLPLWFDLAWVCTQCSTAYPIAVEAEAVAAPIEGCAACRQALEELTGNAGARPVPEPEGRDESRVATSCGGWSRRHRPAVG